LISVEVEPLVLLNKLRGFSAQSSLDAPRFCISAGLPDASTTSSESAGDINSEIYFEEGIDPEVVAELGRESLFLSVSPDNFYLVTALNEDARYGTSM